MKRVLFQHAWAAVLLVVFSAVAGAEERPDDRAWREMPVFDGGRVMPLDTLARRVVRQVTGQDAPRLAPPSDASDPAAAKAIFPDGRARVFSSSELLLDWLVQPERWENVAFLKADHPGLRTELLGVSLEEPDGRRARFVSPRQVDQAGRLHARLRELAAIQAEEQHQGRDFKPNDTDRAAAELNRAYAAFRAMTFNPEKPRQGRQAFEARAADVVVSWGDTLEPQLKPWSQAAGADKNDVGELGKTIDRIGKAARELAALWRQPDVTLAQVEPPVTAMVQAANRLAAIVAALRDRAFADTEAPPAMVARAREILNVVAGQTRHFARLTEAMQRSLFDNELGQGQRMLRLTPSLEPGALEADRDPNDPAPPWISLQELLFASPAAMKGYPADNVAKVREAWADVRTVFVDRSSPDRAKRLADALRALADAVRHLGERAGPLRDHLPLARKDESLLRQTAYPPPGFGRAEMLYNRLDAFGWTWIFTAAGLAALVLGPIAARTCLGKVAQRSSPFAPRKWRGHQQDVEHAKNEEHKSGPGVEQTAQNARAFVVFDAIGIVLLAVGQGFALLGLALRGMVVGMVPVTSMFETVLFVGLVATLLAMLFGLSPAVVAAWRPKQETTPARAWNAAAGRRVVIAAGAFVGLSAYLVAYFTPGDMFDREINLKMAAIVRSNFWLVTHVLVVVASYAPGVLAWGLGDLSLLAFALGRYRVENEPAKEAGVRRPPALCGSLAGAILKSIQLAVLLLAAGTITGAVWGDCAWGRPWGWDRKEVWALITLVVYLLVLHARSARWIGELGVAVGAFVGGAFVLLTWYGVNFLFPGGLHAYGSGDSTVGQTAVFAFLAANLLLALFAVARLRLETRTADSR